MLGKPLCKTSSLSSDNAKMSLTPSSPLWTYWLVQVEAYLAKTVPLGAELAPEIGK